MASWEKFVEVLKKNWWSSGKILVNLWKTLRKGWWNFENSLVKEKLGEIWGKIDEVLTENFVKFLGQFNENLRVKNLMKFWEQFIKILKKFGEILRTVWWNFEENSVKFWAYIGEILGKILEKIWKKIDEILWKIF